MSQVRKIFLMPFPMWLLAVFLLGGCADTSSQNNFDPASGRHPAEWLPAGHTTEARAHMETCADCHGADFRGGISKVACTQCHLGNSQSIHPVQWGNFAYALHANFVRLNGTTSCANVNCHGAALTGVSGPSCTKCHLGGITSFHPPDWRGDAVIHGGYALANGTQTCQNAVCHGPDLKGVFLSGPSCNTCHRFPF